jgi:hypothetical protein
MIGHKVAIGHPVDAPSQETLLAGEADQVVQEPEDVLQAGKVKIGRTKRPVSGYATHRRLKSA